METIVDNQTIESLRAKLAKAIRYMPVHMQGAYLKQVNAMPDDEFDYDWARENLITLTRIKAYETFSRLRRTNIAHTDTFYRTDPAWRLDGGPYDDGRLIRKALYLTHRGDLVTYQRMSGKGSLQSLRRPKEQISDFDSDNLDAFLEAMSIMDAYAR